MALEDLARRGGGCLVSREIGRHEDGFRAQAFCANCGHRGADAERPCLIRSGAYNRPVAFPCDNNRPAAQVRIVALFDRSIERVHVYVNDLSWCQKLSKLKALSIRLIFAYYRERAEWRAMYL